MDSDFIDAFKEGNTEEAIDGKIDKDLESFLDGTLEGRAKGNREA